MGTRNRGKHSRMYKNIFYMLCYAVDELSRLQLSSTDPEHFKSTLDVLCALMIEALKPWLNGSKNRDYRQKQIVTDKPYGKIDLYKSVVSGVYSSGKLACTVNKLSIDSEQNRVIKLAIAELIAACKRNMDEVCDENVVKLSRIMREFSVVRDITLAEYRRNYKLVSTDNVDCRPALAASKIILAMTLPDDKSEGGSILKSRVDTERLKYIFQKFVVNFSKRYLGNKDGTRYVGPYSITTRKSSTGDTVKYMMDLFIHRNDKIIIIDTKWYTGREYSENTRQINDYLRETAYEYRSDDSVKTIFGIVLYAANEYSGEDKALPCDFEKTDRVVDESLDLHLDMRRDFEDIEKGLAKRLDDLTTKSPYWFIGELKNNRSIFNRV